MNTLVYYIYIKTNKQNNNNNNNTKNLFKPLLVMFGQRKLLTAKLPFYFQGSLVLYKDDKHTSGPSLMSNLMQPEWLLPWKAIWERYCVKNSGLSCEEYITFSFKSKATFWVFFYSRVLPDVIYISLYILNRCEAQVHCLWTAVYCV